MGQYQKISKAERELMEILWQASAPMFTAEIMEHLPMHCDWKQTTVITLLGRLVKKGMLTTERSGRAYQYAPTQTKEAYLQGEIDSFVQEVYRGSATGLLVSLCDRTDLNKDEIERLLKEVQNAT